MLTASNDSRIPCLGFYFGITRALNQCPQKKREKKSTIHLPIQQLNHHSHMVPYHMVKDIQENSNNPGSSSLKNMFHYTVTTLLSRKVWHLGEYCCNTVLTGSETNILKYMRKSCCVLILVISTQK